MSASDSTTSPSSASAPRRPARWRSPWPSPTGEGQLRLRARPVPHPARHRHPGQDVRRSYSISSPRSRFAARGASWRSASARSRTACSPTGPPSSIKAGDTIQVMPPDGRFVVKKKRAIHRVGFRPPGRASRRSCRSPRARSRSSPSRSSPWSTATAACRTVMFNEDLQDLRTATATA